MGEKVIKGSHWYTHLQSYGVACFQTQLDSAAQVSSPSARVTTSARSAWDVLSLSTEISAL